MIVITVLVLILLVWGLVGSSEISEVGNTCDFGVDAEGSVFCWKWHQNIIGDIAAGIDELFDE